METRKIILTAASWLLGAAMITFGLNKFLGFISIGPPSDPIAQSFLGSMFSSYLFKFVAITEIIGGALLLNRKTFFLGVVILSPVIANIVIFHLAHDMPGNGIWLFPAVVWIVLLSYSRNNIKALIS